MTLDSWSGEELEELHEIEVTLRADQQQPGQVVPVHLAARVTEVGTLQLDAVATDSSQRWNVELDVRAGDAAMVPEDGVRVDHGEREPAAAGA
jgi:hypothetical protein